MFSKGKAKCAICGFESDNLGSHLKGKHNLSPVEYTEKYPGAPLFSKEGFDKALASSPRPRYVKRDVKATPISKLCPHWKAEFEVEAKVGDRQFSVAPDDFYRAPEKEGTLVLLSWQRLTSRNHVFLYGPTGSGKSQLIINLADLLNEDLIRVNLDNSVTRSELVGAWKVVGGEMVFQYGAIPTAMLTGSKLLLDELPCVNPHVMPILRAVLENKPMLYIPETGEIITPKKGFRIVATGNSTGAGDETGNYVTDQVLSLADRFRFSIGLKLDYPTKDDEKAIILATLGHWKAKSSESDWMKFETHVGKIVDYANDFRKSHKDGSTPETLSVRTTLNWAEKFLFLRDILTAAEVTFMPFLGSASQIMARELLAQVWDEKADS